MEIPYKTLVSIARTAGLDDSAVYADYSGRGMFGKTCAGFIVDERTEWPDLKEAIEFFTEDDFGSPSWDSLGLRSIVYFRKIKCLDAPEEE